MKYEEWIQYERIRLEKKQRQIQEQSHQTEQRKANKSVSSNLSSNQTSDKQPISANQAPLG